MNYYNEWDKPTAAWLQELINQRLIPDGHVDTRSICDVQPGDLDGYTQCHFFAGIGGWSLALQFAGWDPDRPVWTGSCPCQDYSTAGKGLGAKGLRDLWPAWDALIEHHRPDTVFGEQVEAAIRHGWLDRLRADMEKKNYAIGAVVLGAHSVGAPHIRQRLYWLADAQGERVAGVGGECDGTQTTIARTRGHKDRQPVELVASGNAWNTATAIPCADGKSRRVEPSIQLLAHGVPARVVRLRGYGNAIVPQVAAEFITAYMETSHA